MVVINCLPSQNLKLTRIMYFTLIFYGQWQDSGRYCSVIDHSRRICLAQRMHNVNMIVFTRMLDIYYVAVHLPALFVLICL